MPFAAARFIILVLFFVSVVRRKLIFRRSRPVRITTTARLPEYLFVGGENGEIPPYDVPPPPPPSGRRRLLFVPEEHDYDGYEDGDHESVMEEAREWDEHYQHEDDGYGYGDYDDDEYDDEEYELSIQEQILHLLESQEQDVHDTDHGYMHVVERFSELINDEDVPHDDYNDNDNDNYNYGNENEKDYEKEYEFTRDDQLFESMGVEKDDARRGEIAEKLAAMLKMDDKKIDQLIGSNNTRMFEMYRRRDKPQKEDRYGGTELIELDRDMSCGSNGDVCDDNEGSETLGGLVGE